MQSYYSDIPPRSRSDEDLRGLPFSGTGSMTYLNSSHDPSLSHRRSYDSYPDDRRDSACYSDVSLDIDQVSAMRHLRNLTNPRPAAWGRLQHEGDYLDRRFPSKFPRRRGQDRMRLSWYSTPPSSSAHAFYPHHRSDDSDSRDRASYQHSMLSGRPSYHSGVPVDHRGYESDPGYYQSSPVSMLDKDTLRTLPSFILQQWHYVIREEQRWRHDQYSEPRGPAMTADLRHSYHRSREFPDHPDYVDRRYSDPDRLSSLPQDALNSLRGLSDDDLLATLQAVGKQLSKRRKPSMCAIQ